MSEVKLAFGEPHYHEHERTVKPAGQEPVVWTIPSMTFPLLLNGKVVGYADVHMHAAWAGDGLPDASFGFTGRVNPAEWEAAR